MSDEDDTQSDGSLFQENGEMWAASECELEKKLDQHYGVDGIWYYADFHHEERDERLHDVLVYFDGEGEHFIADDVPILGHGPSGAVGVDREVLPPKQKVHEVVESAEGGGSR